MDRMLEKRSPSGLLPSCLDALVPRKELGVIRSGDLRDFMARGKKKKKEPVAEEEAGGTTRPSSRRRVRGRPADRQAGAGTLADILFARDNVE